MADKETALTIKRNFTRAARKYVNLFTNLPIGNVCDAQSRVGALDYRIKPVSQASQFCGTALTVDSGPRDNLAAWAALEIAKPGDIIIINTARGTVIDEAALCRALQENRIAGAGLDVYEEEPFQPDNPLAAMPNVVLTPHISAGTRDALKTKMRSLFENVQRFFKGEAMENQVQF